MPLYYIVIVIVNTCHSQYMSQSTHVESGLVLQPVKQLFSTRGEFLRILYTREGISGYLCRSIVSWTTSSIQDIAGLDIVTRVEETDTIVSTLYRRGPNGSLYARRNRSRVPMGYGCYQEETTGHS